MKIDDIYTSPNPYPPTMNFNEYSRKIEIFIGDRWVEVGEWKTVTSISEKGMHLQMVMPDMRKIFQDRVDLNDGSEDWMTWGVRVN